MQCLLQPQSTYLQSGISEIPLLSPPSPQARVGHTATLEKGQVLLAIDPTHEAFPSQLH